MNRNESMRPTGPTWGVDNPGQMWEDKDAPNPRALRDLARGPGVARLRALTHQRLRHDRFTSARPPTASAPRRGWLPWRHLSRVPRSLVITNTPAHDPRCPVEASSAAQSLTATSATG